MAENDKTDAERRLLTPTPKGEEDFGALRVLDNTVLGICAFVIDYFVILFRLLCKPHTAAKWLSPSLGNVAVARPFVFLFFSVIPWATLINWGHAQNLLLGEMLSEHVRDFSWPRILLTALPITVVSVLMIAGASQLLVRGLERQRELIRIWSYVLGGQYVLAAALLVFVATQTEAAMKDFGGSSPPVMFEVLATLGPWSMILLPVALILVWLYGLALPIIVIRRGNVSDGRGPSSKVTRLRRALAVLLLSAGTLVACSFFYLKFLQFGDADPNVFSTSCRYRIESLKTVMMVRNSGKQPVVMHGQTAAIRYSSTQAQWLAPIVGSQGGLANYLVVEPGEQMWIEVDTSTVPAGFDSVLLQTLTKQESVFCRAEG